MKSFLFLLILSLIFIPSISATEDKACSDIYFLVSNTNYNYTQNQLKNINVTNNDVYNYSTNCNASKYPKLPAMNVPIFKVPDIKKCDYNQDPVFLWVNFAALGSINILNIDANQFSCDKIKSWEYFFNIEKTINNYSIKGIQTVPVVILFSVILFIFIMYLRKSRNKIEKLIETD